MKLGITRGGSRDPVAMRCEDRESGDQGRSDPRLSPEGMAGVWGDLRIKEESVFGGSVGLVSRIS